MPYHIAGIDVHKKMLAVVVADVEVEGDYHFERLKVGTSPAQLCALADWLVEREGGEVVMESTAQYWRPVWEALEQYWRPVRRTRAGASPVSGTLHLAQAQSNRGAGGRKRDFPDAERLVKRLAAQELTLSFVPDAEQRLWRTVMRRKYQVTRNRVQLHNRLESLLEEAHIKLSSLVSDLLGTSARRMLQALADGESDPATLASLADQRLRATAAQLCDAFRACTTLNPVYRRLVKLTLEELRLIEDHLAQLDHQMAQLLAQHHDAVQRLAEVPGLGADSAQQIIAEVGATAATFPSPKHLASWMGACPGSEESAGVNYSHRCPKGNRQMRRVLNQAANAAVKAKGTIFAIVYRRLVPRLGHAQAIGAIAHRLCRLIWKILHQGIRYEERGPAVSAEAKKVRARKMIRELRSLGYPQGEDNVYTTYEGSGGVPISNAFRRLLFSARFKSFKVLLSDDITNGSRVMFHRRVSDRVRRIAPFLQYETEPYLVISKGRLFWLQDAYTTSTRYPYATPAADGTNYIRNSIKVTVDAYHGTTTFYVIDHTDPIVQALQQAFPDLFRPLSEMPEDMRTRLRYPEGVFKLQAAMYATYHMTNPAVFYNKEDQWDIPAIDAQPRPQPMQPYYTIRKLPGEGAAEFIQMLPFTPARKDNLASWMVAQSDGDNYGRMIVFQFPKQKVVFGPRQIVARINQDQAIAPQITLWNQQGSEVLQGTLLVIPIEESLIYIRPLYLRSAGGRIPELKRVILAHRNQIMMEPTLDKALDRLFPTDGPSRRGQGIASFKSDELPDRPPEDDGLRAQAVEHYRNAMQAQRDGNWARYGDEIRRLGEVLERMRSQ